MNSKNIVNFIGSATLALLVGVTSPAYGDDTEIYFTQTGSNSLGDPNVLFILDTSSSMNSLVKDNKGTPDTSDDVVLGTRLELMKSALRSIITGLDGVNVGLMRFHTNGGPVLYPIAPINAEASLFASEWDVLAKVNSSSDDAQQRGTTVTLDSKSLLLNYDDGASRTTIAQQIQADNDDVEASVSTLTIQSNSSDLEILKDGSSTQIVGLRFSGVAIPTGATIEAANISLVNDVGDATSPAADAFVDIWGENTGNAAVFSTGVDLKARLDAGLGPVDWDNIPEVTAVAGVTLTPDLTGLVQGMVDHAGWGSGNAMTFMFAADPAKPTSKDTKRVFHSNNADQPATLTVTYALLPATGTPGEQTTGLRFTNVNIPQGVQVEEAFVELVARQASGDNPAVKIFGENVGDAATFAVTDNDLTDRPRTSTAVDWTVPDTTATGELVRVDIAPVIQKIIERPDWCGGNALALLFESASALLTQQFFSFDGSPTNTPTLRVKFSHSAPLSAGTNGCYASEEVVPIVSGLDDVEQTGTSLSTASSDLEFLNDSVLQKIGLHFKNVQVPPDAPVLSAHIEFVAKDSLAGVMNPITIKIQNDVNPADFNPSGSNEVSGRTYVNPTSVAWTPEPWTAGITYRTADIKPLVDKLLAKPDWDSGDAMLFKFEGVSGNVRRAQSYENGTTSLAPKLIIALNKFFDPSSPEPVVTVRDKLLEVVDELQYKTGTPIVDALLEGAYYFRGDPVLYGKVRGNAGNRDEFTRVSHPASYTGGTVVADPICDTNPNDILCRTEQIVGSPVYKSPILSECQENIMVMLSDGAAGNNSSTTEIKSLISEETGETYSSCLGSYQLFDVNGAVVSTNTVSSSESCGVDLTDFLYDEDQSDLEGVQNIKTYSIGFNFSGPFLEGLATADRDENVKKDFFLANTAAELTDVFNQILKSIADAPATQAAPSLSVNAFNRLFHRNDVYFSLFKPSLEKGWIGNVKKYRICSGDVAKAAIEGDCALGELIDSHVPAQPIIDEDLEIVGTAQSFWDDFEDGPTVNLGGAGAQIPAYGSRAIYTYLGSDTDLTSSANAFNTINAADVTNLGAGGITPGMLGLPDTITQDELEEMIEWVAGKDVDDEDKDLVVAENRWAFADPLHGGPLPITFGGNDLNPVIKIYVGANDGSLRQIDAETGNEDWVFFPPETLVKQAELRSKDVGDHTYGLDGTPGALIKDLNGNGVVEPSLGDRVYLYIGMRSGGRNYYGLDITPTADVTADADGFVVPPMEVEPQLLWVIKGGSDPDFAKLGESWSKPKVTDIRVTTSGSNTAAKSVLIFGGGYDNSLDEGVFATADQGNALFIVDALTGERLWWASHGEIGGVAATNSGADLEFDDMLYAIPSDIALLDSNGDGQTDRLYFGDTGGQVWRIDLGDQIGASSPDPLREPTGGRIAVLSNPLVAADQRKFFYAPDVLQVKDHLYSDQSNYDLVLIASGDRAKPLEKVVHNRAYALRDYNYSSKFDESNQTDVLYPLTHGGDGDGDGDADFFDATDNSIQVGSDAEQVAATTSLRESDGWFIDLSDGGAFVGEKALASPIVLAGIMFFTTYIPIAADDPCAPNVGIGRLFGINALNASAAFQEWGGDSDAFETGDRIYDLGGGIPSAAVPIFQKAGITLLVGGGGGATSVNPNISLPRVKTFWAQD